jgi:hypothetical protein
MKSTRMMELRTTMPAPAMKPIIEVAVKNAPIAACAGRMPTSENGMTVITMSGVDVVLEPADHEHVDQDTHGAEGEAEVAEDLEGDLPLAVPLDGGFAVVGGHGEVVELDAGRWCRRSRGRRVSRSSRFMAKIA